MPTRVNLYGFALRDHETQLMATVPPFSVSAASALTVICGAEIEMPDVESEMLQGPQVSVMPSVPVIVIDVWAVTLNALPVVTVAPPADTDSE